MAYQVGLVIGGALTGLALWLVGGLVHALPTTVRDAVLIVGAGGLLIPAGRRLSSRLPQRTWQIPQDVFRWSPVAGSFRFGLELGVGFRTYVSSPWAYVALLTVVLYAATPVWALVLGVSFGVGRGLLPAMEMLHCRSTRDDSDSRSTAGMMRAIDLLGMAAVVGVAIAS